ncbi:MAG: hypothetical protein ABI867_23635 [Kofleriaceae bacterium]
MTTAKAKSKPAGADQDKINELIAAIGEYASEAETDQLWAIDHALTDGFDRALYARALLDKGIGSGAVTAWLRLLAEAGSADDERALVELATRATSGRLLLLGILEGFGDRVSDRDLAAAIAQLEVASPFHRLVLGRGRKAVRASGNTTLAGELDARAGFVERHAGVLANLHRDAKEKAQVAATAAIAALPTSEHTLAAMWLLDATVPRDAKRWARTIAIVDPGVPLLIAADGVNDDSIYDDEEKTLGELVRAAGADGLARVAAILDITIYRGWVEAIEHLAAIAPDAFRHPLGFAAVLRGFAREDHVTGRLCEEARHWIKGLHADQAAQLAEILLALNATAESGDDDLRRSAERAMFYFQNPGGLAAFAAALATDITDHVRDQVYDAVENIETRDAQDVLIGQLFVETRCLRDLVFAFNKLCMPDRHADVLARLDANPAFDAAWLYCACQFHWANRPRFGLDVVERVLAWPVSGDPKRRANIMSQGLQAALELRRYALAKRCLEQLGDARTSEDPTEAEPAKTLLANKDVAKQLTALRSGKLEAEQAALADEIATARAARTPMKADDERLGMLAGGKLEMRVHGDRDTKEVWFFDAEGMFFYYDGYGIAQPPFELATLALVNGWDLELPGLAEFCAGWHTDGRSLHQGERDVREVVRSDDRILILYRTGAHPLLSFKVFALRFPDLSTAELAFESLHANPQLGFREVDPFYVAGKRGGAYVREFGNATARIAVVGSAIATGDKKWGLEQRPCGSREAAVAAFEAAVADHLQRGLYPREIELNDRLRPLDDTPLKEWMEDRERDDNQPPGWHLQALPAIHQAMQLTGLPMTGIEIELGAPATDAELAAYDAALPDPMPDEMRQMWKTASTARWKVGKASARLLSPAEVASERDKRRREIAKRIGTVKRAAKAGWEPEFLDPIVVTPDETAIAFDTRQQEADSWLDTTSENLAHHTETGLAWMLAEGFASDFVDALVEKFPEIKKLKYGQNVAAAAAKKKPAAKKKRA